MSPEQLEPWLKLLSNYGVLFVIGIIVIAFGAGTLYLIWLVLRDALPGLRGFFTEIRETNISNREALKGIDDTLRSTQEFHRAVVDDRRHCAVNTELALLGTDLACHILEGHPKEAVTRPIIQQMRDKAVGALTNNK